MVQRLAGIGGVYKVGTTESQALRIQDDHCPYTQRQHTLFICFYNFLLFTESSMFHADGRRRKRATGISVMRASQIDAARLDNELTAMLKEQFLRIFSLFQPVRSSCSPRLAEVGCYFMRVLRV